MRRGIMEMLGGASEQRSSSQYGFGNEHTRFEPSPEVTDFEVGRRQRLHCRRAAIVNVAELGGNGRRRAK